MTPEFNEKWMSFALSLAKNAESCAEVPVGAIIVKDEKIISSGFNFRENQNSPIAHAEILAIDRASQRLNSWRLIDCTLYVTLEPCIMCSGAIIQSRIPQVIYGADDPKGGALGSLFQLHADKRLNHNPCVIRGIRQGECSELLKDFFRTKRKVRKQ